MHALADVHHLAHPAVAHHGGERVGLVTAQRHHLLGGEEIHRLAHRVDHRLVQILVEPGHDPVGRRLDARPVELHVLAHDELHDDLAVRALERGEIHLAVALAAVRVARPHETALEEDRDEDGRPGLQLVDVHVRAVLPRPERGDRRHRIRRAALARRGVLRIDADRERAREGLQVDRDAGLELGLLLVEIEVEVLHEAVRHLGRERADGGELLAGQVEVGGEGLRRDFQYPDLHHVTGLRPVDVDGPGQRVRAAARVGLPEGDDLVHGGAGLDLVVRVHHRLDRDGIAGIDHELRRLVRIEPAPLGGLERGGKRVERATGHGHLPVALAFVGRLRQRVEADDKQAGEGGERGQQPLAGPELGHHVSPLVIGSRAGTSSDRPRPAF